MIYCFCHNSLCFYSCCTRPDIAFAVNKLAKYSNNPGIAHYRALLYLIGYAKGTPHKFLKFYSNMKDNPFTRCSRKIT